MPARYRDPFPFSRNIEERWPAVPWQNDRAFLKFIRAFPTTLILGGSQDEREQLAAALLKFMLRFNYEVPRNDYAYFSDAYKEMFDLKGPDRFQYMADLTNFSNMVLLEVQHIDTEFMKPFRMLLWARKGKTTIFTADNAAALRAFSPAVQELLANRNTLHL